MNDITAIIVGCTVRNADGTYTHSFGRRALAKAKKAAKSK